MKINQGHIQEFIHAQLTCICFRPDGSLGLEFCVLCIRLQLLERAGLETSLKEHLQREGPSKTLHKKEPSEARKWKSRVCLSHHYHGYMVLHVDTLCIYLGFILLAHLTFLSVSELICHVLFLVLCIFS